MNQKRQRGISATPNGIKLLREAQGSFESGPLTYEKIAEGAKVSEKTVGRLFRGKGIDKHYALAIVKFLGLSYKDVLSLEELLVEESIKSIESPNNPNIGRATKLIEELETALDDLKQTEEANLQGMDWLKANRKALSREAAEVVLQQYNGQSYSSINELEIDQFSREIRKYLQLLYYCLEEGSWEIIDRAIQESLIPVDREVELYTKALTFIKEQKLGNTQSPEIVQSIMPCLDYLINVLPIRF